MGLDLGKELQDFYEKNKDNIIILSKEEIIAKSNSLFSFSIYKIMPEWKEHFPQMIFGLKKGAIFTASNFILLRKGELVIFDYRAMRTLNVSSLVETTEFTVDGITFSQLSNRNIYFELLLSLKEEVVKIFEQIYTEQQKQEATEEKQRLATLKVSQNNILKELDKDGNGEVDVVEGNDFSLLLKKHQKSIIEIDRTYVQQFVKVSSYLKTKKNNIQSMFNSIKDTSNKEELNEYVGILKNEIHSYTLILFNSLNMIVSLVEDDMITFYEIHDSFDQLNIFNSNWENEVSQKLTNIGDGLSNLMYSVEEMGQNISNEIGQLSYVTEESNRMLSNQLQEIDSSLQTNNLLTVIQNYQMYKINKNTKGLIN